MKKKKIKLLVASMAVAAILVGGTLAWFQFHETLPNKFTTTGEVKTNIHEKFDPNSPEAKNMQPGVKVQKNVTIQNIGEAPALIRVKLDPEWDAKGTEGQAGYLAKEPATAEQLSLNLNKSWETDWMKGSDGYYYYKHIVNSKTSTSELLDSVNLLKNFDLTANYQDRGLTVNVESSAVQTTDGAWQDIWNKDKTVPEDVQTMLKGIQTNNTTTTTTTKDSQKPLAK